MESTFDTPTYWYYHTRTRIIIRTGGIYRCQHGIIGATRPHGVSRHYTDRVYVQAALMPLQQYFTAIHIEKKRISYMQTKQNAQWNEVLLRSVISLLKFHDGHLPSPCPVRTTKNTCNPYDLSTTVVHRPKPRAGRAGVHYCRTSIILLRASRAAPYDALRTHPPLQQPGLPRVAVWPMLS